MEIVNLTPNPISILFLHGWKSVVGGRKPTYLIQCGHRVFNPKLDDNDFALALETAQDEYDRQQPDLIVGSSRGGAVAMNLETRSTPMVLLCPAWKNWGKMAKVETPSFVLHSRADDVIPFEDSVELVQNSNLPDDRLIETGTEHRLADSESLSKMHQCCLKLVKT